jgi:enediyne polyketide synthase
MTLLPVAVRSITVLGIAAGDGVFVHARETSHEGANFVYDIDVIDASGKVIERWEGLLLRAVERNRHRGAWDPALLGPYLERRIGELAPRAQLSVAVNTTPGERRERSNGALHAALDGNGTVSRRPDGKPVVNGTNGVEANGNGAGSHVSAAHSGGIAIAVAGHEAVGVDIESVAPRTEAIWNDLLGNDRYRLALLMSRESGEQSDTAATRVWCSAESMLKLGLVPDAPLTLSAYDTDGWALLRSGARTIATYAQPPESSEHAATVIAIAFTAEPSESRAIAQAEEMPREAPAKAKRNGRAGDRSVASGATTGVIAAEPEAGKP